MFAVILDLESGQTAVQTYKVCFKIGVTCTYFRSSQPVHYYGKLYSKVFVILQTKLLNYSCNQQRIEIPLVCCFILNAFTCAVSQACTTRQLAKFKAQGNFSQAIDSLQNLPLLWEHLPVSLFSSICGLNPALLTCYFY